MHNEKFMTMIVCSFSIIINMKMLVSIRIYGVYAQKNRWHSFIVLQFQRNSIYMTMVNDINHLF